MIQRLGEKWRSFWHSMNRLLLAMDVDPLEDLHRRLRQLEVASLAQGADRHCAATSRSAQEVDGSRGCM
jgi:hypothetical protein